MIHLPDVVAAIEPVVTAFEEMGVMYHLGGSVVSSFYGLARSTIDIDVVAALKEEHIEPLVTTLSPNYYIDGDMIGQAIEHSSSFNLIHLTTIVKIDVFIPKQRLYDQAAFARKREASLDEEPDAPSFYLATAEDIILNKLEWFRMGGHISERQWLDVLGVMKVQKNLLDTDYLRYWAGELEVSDLLDRAFEEAGYNETS